MLYSFMSRSSVFYLLNVSGVRSQYIRTFTTWQDCISVLLENVELLNKCGHKGKRNLKKKVKSGNCLSKNYLNLSSSLIKLNKSQSELNITVITNNYHCNVPRAYFI